MCSQGNSSTVITTKYVHWHDKTTVLSCVCWKVRQYTVAGSQITLKKFASNVDDEQTMVSEMSFCICCYKYPDSKVHGANMGPTWVLSVPDGPHVGPRNLAIRVAWLMEAVGMSCYMSLNFDWSWPVYTVTLTVIWASERHGVSNCQQLDYVQQLVRLITKIILKLCITKICERNPPVTDPLWRMLFRVMTSSYYYESPGGIGNAGVFSHRMNLMISHYIVNVYNTHVEYI